MAEFMSVPLHQTEYQPCGDLWLEFPKHRRVDSYRRWLDLDRAVATTEYRVGDVTYRREVLASYPDQAIMLHATCDKPGQLRCIVRLISPHRDAHVHVENGDTLRLRGQVEQGGIEFEARAQVTVEGGHLAVDGDCAARLRCDESHHRPGGRHQLSELPRRWGGSGRPLPGSAATLSWQDVATDRGRPSGRPPETISRGPPRPRADGGSPQADRRAHRTIRQRQRSASGGARLSVWPLPADRVQPARRAAGKSPGDLERGTVSRPGAANTRATSTPR